MPLVKRGQVGTKIVDIMLLSLMVISKNSSQKNYCHCNKILFNDVCHTKEKQYSSI